MRQSRLLSILLLLQTRGRMTARALADELETSVRTIHRDIDQLSAAGVPVYADRGRTGGFQLLDGYRTRLTGLTPAEAEALFLAGLPGPAADLGLGEAMAGAQLKLLAALPEGRRDDAGRIATRFHLDPVGWCRSAEDAALLPALAGAVWNSLRIRVRYESWSSVVERDLDPLGLALKGGVWYLVAAPAASAPRTYRVAAIKALTISDEGFTRAEGFDLSAYWNAWTRDFEARLIRGEASVRLSPKGLQRLCALAPVLGEQAARTAGAPDAEGWVRAQIPIESIDHAAGDLLRLGAEAEVLEPPELREAIGGIVERLAAAYGRETRSLGPAAPVCASPAPRGED
jgi:predicted DNA-binding transcriptional regulator YafY